MLPNVGQEKKKPTLSEEELARFRKMAAEYEQMRNMEGPERLLKQAEFHERLSKMTEKEREEERQKWMIAILTAAYNSPIDFWGRVVDQDGSALQGAIIHVTVNDHNYSLYPEEGNDSVYKKVSDSNGHFEIRNKRGASLTVKASAKGYAAAFHKKRKRDLSRADIDYAGEDNNMRHRRPTKDNPTVLVLRKKNPIANLSHLVKSNTISILKDGTPLVIEVKEEGRGFDIEVRC